MRLEDIGFYTLSDKRAQNLTPYDSMKRCELIITEYCNFKCPYCRGLDASIYGNRPQKQLALPEIKSIIDKWCDHGPVENIRFSGGEPTLHKHIREIVQYAKSKGAKRIAISTNGSNKLELYKQLIVDGVNDYSISLDACCADVGDKMAGGVAGAWQVVVDNISALSKLTYVTVGVVLAPENVGSMVDTIIFAHGLGVADIRIISAAQWNGKLIDLNRIPDHILEVHPILKYRAERLASGLPLRGIGEQDSHKCPLVLDDAVVAGNYHFPCVIYMRERGAAIGSVGDNMRSERIAWYKRHDTHTDNICKRNCLDVCVAYCNKANGEVI